MSKCGEHFDYVSFSFFPPLRMFLTLFFCDVNAILEYIYNFFFFFYIYIHKGLSSGSFQIQLRESILSFNDFIVSTFARAFFSLFNYIRREEIDKKTLYKLYI